ncbi:MAG: aspartate aminotransferase family protein [Mucinivorans sp.]
MNTLRHEFLAHCAQCSPEPMLIEVERAEGVFLYSPNGKRYLDLVSGVSVSNVGHSNKQVVAAVQEQAARYMHTMVYGETVQRVQVEYAKLVTSLLGNKLDSLYFVNSGSEAIEGAIKLAKRATARTEIISMRGAYHGSSHGALSIQGGENYKTAFRPLLPDTRLIEFNNFDDLSLITQRTACVVFEAVQGEAGVRLASENYLTSLIERCHAVGALAIIDEVQTGFGRTGEIFAIKKYGLQPDIVCLAKALGGGMPLGAFVASQALMAKLTFDPVLGHITTFGGNPVCCAAGMAATRYILDNDLCRHAEQMGALFERELAIHPAVQEIRRSGLLLAVELGGSEKLMRMMGAMTENGIMSDWFLFCDTSFRISPPLVISAVEVCAASVLLRRLLDTL